MVERVRSSELSELIDAVRAAFHQLAAAARDVHAEVGLTAGHRGVLVDVLRHGPQTVPHMARKRPVSRQHIQSLVNDLADLGLVELRKNPAHKRSRLVTLTGTGKEEVQRLLTREEAYLSALPLVTRDDEIRAAAGVLRDLRQALRGSVSGPASDRARDRS